MWFRKCFDWVVSSSKKLLIKDEESDKEFSSSSSLKQQTIYKYKLKTDLNFQCNAVQLKQRFIKNSKVCSSSR